MIATKEVLTIEISKVERLKFVPRLWVLISLVLLHAGGFFSVGEQDAAVRTYSLHPLK